MPGPVAVAVRVAVTVAVLVAVDVTDAVRVAIAVCVTVPVLDAVRVCVDVGDGTVLGVSVTVGVLLRVTVLVAVLVLVAVAVTVPVTVTVPRADVTVVVGGGLTVTGAVLPVGTTAKLPPSAVALLKYDPGVVDAFTLKWSEMEPGVCPLAAGMSKGPLHVSVWEETAGSEVVAPVLEPGT